MDKSGSAPPQYASPPPQQMATTSVIGSGNRPLGPTPQPIICPSCHAQVTTMVRAETSTKTHIAAFLLCFVWCCCIPYCVDTCKSRNHYCPNCSAYLGAYNN